MTDTRRPPQTLIAGVGYRNLRDLSFGPALIDAVEGLAWPSDVMIEDLSYGPVAVYQWFLEHRDRFCRAIFISAAARGRVPGRLYQYGWRGSSEDEEAVQARVAEALTGVISLDNLLVICEHFGVLPGEVKVIEVEPRDEGWGPGLSDDVAACLDEAIGQLRAALCVGAGSAGRQV